MTILQLLHFSAPAGLPEYARGIRIFGSLGIPADSENLYFVGEPKYRPCDALAIPYAMWNNNGKANMSVWLRCR